MPDKTIVADIERAISASYELRNKRDLIEAFIDSLTASDDVAADWQKYIAEAKERELTAIIEEEALDDGATRRFMADALREGDVPKSGTGGGGGRRKNPPAVFPQPPPPPKKKAGGGGGGRASNPSEQGGGRGASGGMGGASTRGKGYAAPFPPSEKPNWRKSGKWGNFQGEMGGSQETPPPPPGEVERRDVV